MLQSDLNVCLGMDDCMQLWLHTCKYVASESCRDCKPSEGVITPAATEHRQKTQAGGEVLQVIFHPFCFLRKR